MRPGSAANVDKSRSDDVNECKINLVAAEFSTLQVEVEGLRVGCRPDCSEGSCPP